ncbi:hypothetical protein XENOCAPTIV_016093 [Xenoophorus captivus]|uniref:Uncharacterized protein n=1 Tax=Xenoophorus captivus TaxID=1517983 RepID=A0ABV0S9M2_9TELE
MVRELQDQEGSLPSLVSKGRPNRGGASLLSYLSDPSHTSAESGPQSPYIPSYPSTSLGGSRTQLFFGEEEEQEARQTFDGKVAEEEWGGVSETSSGETTKTASLVALPRSSTPDILRKHPSGEPDPETQSATVQQRAEQESPNIPTDTETLPSMPSTQPPVASPALAPPAAPTSGRPRVSSAQRRTQSTRLGALMAELEKSFHSESSTDKELRLLQHQIQHLVFLSFSISSFQQSTLKSLGLLSKDSQSASEEELVIAPLTSGNWGLDQALETHLDICCILQEVWDVTKLLIRLKLKSYLESLKTCFSCLLQDKVEEHTCSFMVEN